MFLSKAAEYFKLTLIMTKINILSEMQYRLNFIMKIFGMFINDSAMVLLWIIFFKKFPSLNGWTIHDTSLLIGIAWTGGFIVNFFFGGIFNLAHQINSGKLDQNLLLPKSVLWQVSTSSSYFWDIGTLIVCIYMFYLSGFVTIYNLPFVLFLVLNAAIITYNFFALINSLAFYFGNIEYAIERITRTFFDFVFYPQNIFQGILKIISIFVIPIFFIAAIPVELIKEFNLKYFIILMIFTIVQTLFTRWFFQTGLKKYESGNLINIRL